MKIDILGTIYTVERQSWKDNSKLIENDGLCETYSKRLIINQPQEGAYDLENIDDYFDKVLRHEIFHAIFHEIGLDKYSQDETLVDALSILYPKIEKIMKNATLKNKK